MYNDYEHFSFPHAHKPYLEFPVTNTGSVYDGASPGADRIVIGSIAEDYSSAIYCAVITHDGQRKNNFAECADDTMCVLSVNESTMADPTRAGMLEEKESTKARASTASTNLIMGESWSTGLTCKTVRL